MANHTRNHREDGVVSLLSVIFFMIFISLITVVFVTIVSEDQKQAVDNDLSASALAAARGGVEDGKRILIYCQQNPAADGCDDALNSQNNCNAFDSGQTKTLANDKLSIPIDEKGEGSTGGATEYKQYFTCLTIQTKTPSASTVLSSGNDYIQRLKTVAPFSKLRVSWSGDGAYANRTSDLSGWPQDSAWKSGAQAYMPVVQLQVIPYEETSFSDPDALNALEARTRTVYIVPCAEGIASCVTPKDINLIDGRTTAGALRIGTAEPPITYAGCTVSATNSYSCSAVLSGFSGGSPGTTQYYIRVGVLYADTTKLTYSALDGSDNSVNFDNVQPWIDVTGRTNDVFRRVRAEVSYAQPTMLPRNALDSAAPICKDMIVTNAAATSTYNCGN